MSVNPKLEAILDEWGDPKGWDSLDQLQVISQIEDALHIELGDVWFTTREEIENLVEQKLNEK